MNTDKAIRVSQAEHNVVNSWGSSRYARIVRISRLPIEARAALKCGNDVILTDCPPSQGHVGSTERRIICRNRKYYTRCV